MSMTTNRQAIAQSLNVVKALTPGQTIPQHRILNLIVPSIDIINSLEQLVKAKQAKGIKVSAQFLDWLDLVRCIRADLPHELDAMVAEDWQEASEVVGRYVTDAQPALLDVPRTAAY
jgi:hypothetical protein